MAEVKTKTVKIAKPEAKKVDFVVAKVVRTIQASERHATAKTKKRGEVSGGGKKPWKQKGTGRARVGSSRSPIWRGGGIVFGPTGVQNFKVKASKKEKSIALATAFEAKKAVTVSVSMPKPKKTKEAADFMKKNDLSGKVLALLDIKVEPGHKQTEAVAALKQAFRNIPNIRVMFKSEANVVDVLAADKIAILTEKVAEKKVEAK